VEHELYLLQKHIDSLLFDEIINESFQGIDIGDIIRNTHCDIVIGHKNDYDEINKPLKNPADNPDFFRAKCLIKVLDKRKLLNLK